MSYSSDLAWCQWVERIGLIDDYSLATEDECREAVDENRGCQDDLSLHGRLCCVLGHAATIRRRTLLPL